MYLPYEPVSYALYRLKEMLEHSCNAVFFYYIGKEVLCNNNPSVPYKLGYFQRLDFFHQKTTGNVPASEQYICGLYFLMNVNWLLRAGTCLD